MPDGTSRLHKDGEDLQSFSAIGAMAERAVVPAAAAVKLPHDAPLEKAALIGCSVMTGVGAVWHTGGVEAGSRVAGFGAGGVGVNVIQGAAGGGGARIIGLDVPARTPG